MIMVLCKPVYFFIVVNSALYSVLDTMHHYYWMQLVFNHLICNMKLEASWIQVFTERAVSINPFKAAVHNLY